MERVTRIDIEKSFFEVFKYRFYKDKKRIPIIILENEEVVDLSEYKAKVYFKFPNDDILFFDCIIEKNILYIPLSDKYFTKEERVVFEIVFTGKEQIVTTFKMYLDI